MHWSPSVLNIKSLNANYKTRPNRVDLWPSSAALKLPQGLRKRVTKTEEFWFNCDCETMEIPHGTLEPAGVLRVPRKR